ncbi:hypothetical protein N431DRAFT_495347 [Stipitochalara longipes BDJ]|nr:hypothetical protein N431DRAFT_495347 [Stipitochalara longipes BDJ]
MSASMRNWIGPLVETELHAALTSFEGTYVPGQSVQEGCRACGPDSVTVHFKKGRVVQVIELNGRSGHPFEATVSDGTTHIRATFDQAATDLFAKMSGRDFLQIRGAVIALLEYNIVSKFKFRGSEGSNPFGRPSDVFKNDKIRQVLWRLEELLDHDGHENEIRSQPPSPIRPREIEILAGVNSLSSNSASQEETSVSRGDIEVPKAGISSYLIDLLSKNVPPAEQGGSSTAKATSSIPSTTSAHAVPRKAMTSKLEAKANEQSSLSSLSQDRQASDSKSTSASVIVSNLKDLPELHSEDSEKENSQESLKAKRPTVDSLKIQTMQPTVEQEIIQMSIVDQFRDSNPFTGLKRSQERLLEDKESWYKPPIDNRSTYANLPAKVRDGLIAFSNRLPAFNEPTGASQASEVDNDDSDDGEEAQQKSSACESEDLEENEEVEEEENSESIDDEEDQAESSRIRLEIPPRTGGSSHQTQKSQTFATDSNERQTTLSSSGKPGHIREEMDKTCQSESNSMADEDTVSWASTPEHQSMALKLNIENHNRPSSSASNHGGLSELSGSNRRHSPNMRLGAESRLSESTIPSPSRHRNDTLKHTQTTRRLWPRVAIRSSSPAEEEELEYAIPYAIGDFVEESDTEEKPQETFQGHPPTASQYEELVQVEQTPFSQLRYSGGRSLQIEEVDTSLKGSLRVDDLISSDPRIPATCEASAPDQTTPESSKATTSHKELNMRMLTVEYTSDWPQHANHLHAKLNIKEEDEEDDISKNQLSNEHETSQLVHTVSSANQDAISLDTVGRLKESCPEKQTGMVTPSRNQGRPHVTVQQSSPLETPLLTKCQTDGNSFVTIGSGKRGSDHLVVRPQNPAKRRRHAPTGVARMIKEENYPARDTKELARINRHNFNDNLPLAKENALTTQSRSHQEYSSAKGVIPSTNPAIAKSSAPLPEPAAQSSARDDVQHVPATFEEPTSTLQRTSFRSVDKQMQSTEIDRYHCFDPASSNDEMDASCVSDAKEDDTILRGTYLPMTDLAAHSQVDYYEEFTHIYPAYLGSKNAFARALVNIEWIRENGLFLPWARYDDFIRILASDWLDYVEKNRGLGNKLMSGLKYYEINFPDQPSFEFKFITGENLQDALASLDAEQVARYRAKYREPFQKEAEPVQTPKLVSLDTVATKKCIPMDLDTEEQTFLPNSREASPELGSTNGSVFDSRPVFYGREASPELGSANRESNLFDHRLRQPFFETHSQLPIAQRQAGTPESRRSGTLDLNASEPNSHSSRIFPWNKDHLTSSPNLSSRLEAKFSTPTASKKNRDRLPSRSPVHVSRSEPLRPTKRVKKHSSTPPSRDLAVYKRHSLPTSSVSSLPGPIIPKHATIPERLTSRRPMLQEFLARREKTGSTPKTTPGKRFCTKPVRTPPKQLEPETQGLDV